MLPVAFSLRRGGGAGGCHGVFPAVCHCTTHSMHNVIAIASHKAQHHTHCTPPQVRTVSVHSFARHGLACAAIMTTEQQREEWWGSVCEALTEASPERLMPLSSLSHRAGDLSALHSVLSVSPVQGSEALRSRLHSAVEQSTAAEQAVLSALDVLAARCNEAREGLIADLTAACSVPVGGDSELRTPPRAKTRAASEEDARPAQGTLRGAARDTPGKHWALSPPRVPEDCMRVSKPPSTPNAHADVHRDTYSAALDAPSPQNIASPNFSSSGTSGGVSCAVEVPRASVECSAEAASLLFEAVPLITKAVVVQPDHLEGTQGAGSVVSEGSTASSAASSASSAASSASSVASSDEDNDLSALEGFFV